jgi:CpeT protein
MRTPAIPALLVSLLLATTALAAAAEPAPPPNTDLDQLVAWMTGLFSSAHQAAADTNYFDIRLRMAPIWTSRTDGRWLYVEQAVVTALERPYRQRVYRVTGPDAGGAFSSEVYALPGPRRFAGAWRQPEPLKQLTPDSLLAREGCAVVLRRAPDGSFTGGTEGHGCASDLRGAAYATSEVTVGPDGLVSWDRGFASDGTQAWGATGGGYVFEREPADAPWPVIAHAAWLAGSWQVQDGATVVDETWTPPRGDAMLGVSRTVEGGRLASFELVVLRETLAGGLVFTAHPSGQESGSFPAVTITDTLLVFENPAHDFPQRIGYRRTADGVTAWIEGTVDGQAKRAEFPYRRP